MTENDLSDIYRDLGIESPEYNSHTEDNVSSSTNSTIPANAVLDETKFSCYVWMGDIVVFNILIDYLKATSNIMVFTFTESTMSLHPNDTKVSMLNYVEFCVDNFFYNYSGPPQGRLGIKIEDLNTIIKTMSRQDNIVMYHNDDDVYNRIYITNNVDTNNPSRSNFSSVVTQRIPISVEYTLPSYETSERYPTHIISSGEFTLLCTRLSKVKCRYIEIWGYDSGIAYRCSSENGKCNLMAKYGKIEDEDNPTRGKIHVHPTHMKALGKIGNMNKLGLIKIYMERDKPLKICSPVGNIARIRIFVRSVVD